MSTKLRLLFVQLACLAIALANTQPTSHTTTRVESSLTLPVGYVQYRSMNTAFKFHRQRRSWSAANQVCISEGGRLAVIDTRKKVKFIKSHNRRRSTVWIGIVRRQNNWVSADANSRLSHLPWAPSHPKRLGNCVAVKKTAGTGLINRLCISTKPFVCEIPAVY